MILPLAITCVILFIVCVLLFFAGVRTSRQAQAYEEFYANTLEDVNSVIHMTGRLMQRQLISDDPDVQNFHRVLTITHDTLLRYAHAGRRAEREKKKEEEE